MAVVEGGKVAAELETEPFSTKELVVIVPLIGTALAISYDVGYFYGLDINLFTLFSVAEHVVFALQAAPFALAIALIVVAAVGSRFDIKVGQLTINVLSRRKLVLDVILLLLIAVPIGLAIYFQKMGFAAGFVTGGFVALSRIIPLPKNTVYLAASVLAIITAFAMGHDNARSYLLSGQVSHAIQIDKELDSRLVKIIRSGDKGLLYYEAQNKHLVFVRWEAIKKLTSIW